MTRQFNVYPVACLIGLMYFHDELDRSYKQMHVYNKYTNFYKRYLFRFLYFTAILTN